jgi:hypothetical protein
MQYVTDSAQHVRQQIIINVPAAVLLALLVVEAVD